MFCFVMNGCNRNLICCITFHRIAQKIKTKMNDSNGVFIGVTTCSYFRCGSSSFPLTNKRHICKRTRKTKALCQHKYMLNFSEQVGKAKPIGKANHDRPFSSVQFHLRNVCGTPTIQAFFFPPNLLNVVTSKSKCCMTSVKLRRI